MNTQQPQTRILPFLIGLAVVAAIGLIVLAAIGAGVLGWLLVGVVLLGIVAIGIANVGVNLFSRYTDASIKTRALQYGHIEYMAKIGYTQTGSGYVPLQLPEPLPDIPVSLDGITAEQLREFKILAVNLLALSKQEMGDTSDQVIPYHRARSNEYFKDVAVWSNAVRYLLANKIATERYKNGKNGKKKEGTFMIVGTVGQAFEVLNRS